MIAIPWASVLNIWGSTCCSYCLQPSPWTHVQQPCNEPQAAAHSPAPSNDNNSLMSCNIRKTKTENMKVVTSPVESIPHKHALTREAMKATWSFFSSCYGTWYILAVGAVARYSQILHRVLGAHQPTCTFLQMLLHISFNLAWQQLFLVCTSALAIAS